MGRGLFLLLALVVFSGCGRAQWRTVGEPVDILTTGSDGTVNFRLATYNLKFYGSGGGFNKPVEHRDSYLKKFILQELSAADAVVFTEVVDVARLKKLVAERWQCDGYDRSQDPSQKWHQHITICYDARLYRVEKYDDDWVIPEHAIGSRFLRPALQAKVCKVNGPCFLQVLGVHLKAGPNTDRRIKQIETLRDELDKQVNPLPTIITGDFNSYRKDRTRKPKDDMTYFEEIMSATGRSFRSLTKGTATYGTGDYGRDYDHVMASAEIELKTLKAYAACGKTYDPASSVLPYEKMRGLFSDHCYVSTQLKIKAQ